MVSNLFSYRRRLSLHFPREDTIPMLSEPAKAEQETRKSRSPPNMAIEFYFRQNDLLVCLDVFKREELS